MNLCLISEKILCKTYHILWNLSILNYSFAIVWYKIAIRIQSEIQEIFPNIFFLFGFSWIIKYLAYTINFPYKRKELRHFGISIYSVLTTLLYCILFFRLIYFTLNMFENILYVIRISKFLFVIPLLEDQ